MFLLVTTVSAIDWDNQLYERTTTFDGKLIEGNKLLEQYKPVEIKNLFGAGKTLFQGYLSQHTNYCDIDCSSTIEINLLEDGSLIDDVMFKDLNGDQTTINSYQFYIIKNGNKIPYSLGQIVKAGTYQILLEGRKDFSQTVDWVILSNGEWIESWAFWNDNNGIYDEIDDSSINYTLWANSSITGTTNTVVEDNSKIRVQSTDVGASTVAITFSSIALSPFNVLENMSIRVNLSVAIGVGDAGETCSAKFYAFGNSLKTLTAGPNLGPDYEHDDSVWSFIRKTDGDINVYNDGAYDSTITPSSNEVYVQIAADGTTGKTATAFGDIYYVYANYTPSVILNSPADSYSSPAQWILFNATGNSTVSLANATLWTNISGAWDVLNTTTGLSNSKETVTMYGNITDYIVWNYQFCDSGDFCQFAEANRSVNPASDSSAPNVSITSPTTYIERHLIDTNLTLNWTVVDPNIYVCYYDYSGTNISVPCLDNTTSFTISDSNNRNMTFWAIDSLGYVNSSFASWEYFVFEGGRIYETKTFETAAETFSINITANSSLTDVNLIYNTVSHDTTSSGSLYNVTFDIPSSVGNKTFYWEFIYAGSTINSNNYYQDVNTTLFGICNASLNLTVPYVNFTFIDEETSGYINATIDASTWVYYLGSGTVTKTLLFSNSTANDNYPFCLSASNDTLHNARSIQYASPGYPQRKYDASSDLTNATTNTTLYLLSSDDGIYTTIQVLDTDSNQLTGVEVTAEREFVGIWTVIGQETTDSAGSVTFWVNPDYDHRFTFVKDGCTGTTVTIRPTQTQYTQQLSCGVTSDYTATIEGLKYSRSPTGGIIQPGVKNFTYYLVSSKGNIINASFYLVNASDQSVLNSSVSACTSSGCLLYFTYNVTSGDNLKGKYYVDVGNGSILLEGDAWWKCIDIDSDGKAGIQTLFYDIIFIFQEWGDDANTADFNRLVVIFFLLCV